MAIVETRLSKRQRLNEDAQAQTPRTEQRLQSIADLPTPAPPQVQPQSGTPTAAVSHTDWDVFVSHRGPDTKWNFAEDMKVELPDRNVFVDKSDLHPGPNGTGWDSILYALTTARVVLVVLSDRFQESAYCMEELRIAQQRPDTCRVVYFKTKHGDIDETALKKAFEQYNKSEQLQQSPWSLDPSKDVCDAWRKTLRDVSEVTSFLHDDAKSLRQLELDVATNLQRALPQAARSNEAAYGLEATVSKLLVKVDTLQDAGVRVLGLTGLPGVGKSTLATVLYDALKDTAGFIRSCFVPDVRATLRARGPERLQHMMLHHLAHQSFEPLGQLEGKLELQRRLKGLPVLIVLDDVGDGDASKLLSIPALASGSLVIITSRSRAALSRAGCHHVHSVQLLSPTAAAALFMANAAQDGSLSAAVQQRTVTAVVRMCQGLPLSLKVLGAMLHGKPMGMWAEALVKLRHAGDLEAGGNGVFRQLKLSYDTLGFQEQQMFLDVACVLTGWEDEDARLIWAGCGVACTFKDRLRMHDQLRDMGRALEHSGMTGQPMPGASRQRIWEDNPSWSSLRSLRLLARAASPASAGGAVSQEMSTPQEWTQLQALDLSGHATLPPAVWALTGLRFLSIRGCRQLRELPDGISQLTALRSLDAMDCSRLAALPSGLSQLTSLRRLCLRRCTSLTTLPASLRLSGLTVLNCRACTQLTALSAGFRELSALVRLDLRSCQTLETLPSGLWDVMPLQDIQLDDCSALIQLPAVARKKRRRSLLNLSLRRCSKLTELPEFLGRLDSLRSLWLSGCAGLRHLPDSISCLAQLTSLKVTSCKGLEDLPEHFGQLARLEQLDLRLCHALQTLPSSFGQLSILTYVCLDKCMALQSLPASFGRLRALRHAFLDSCVKLKRLPTSIGDLSQLQRLSLRGCIALTWLPDSAAQLQQLVRLDLSRCEVLSRVQLADQPGQLRMLKHLDLRGCGAVSNLPESFGQLAALTYLRFAGCASLETLPDSIGRLQSLQTAILDTCVRLKQLPDSIGGLCRLQHLSLQGCSALEQLPSSIGQLQLLASIDLAQCELLSDLPVQVAKLKMLKYLGLADCCALLALPKSVGQLTALTSLSLARCSVLQSLPASFVNLQSLQSADLEACLMLQRLPCSMGNLHRLQCLNISGCTRLTDLPSSIGQLQRLSRLDLDRCSELKTLPESIWHLPLLRKLQVADCSNLPAHCISAANQLVHVLQ